MRAELVASGFTQPVAFVQDPSDPTVQLVVQQDGRIRVAEERRSCRPTDYLDLRSVVRNSGEQGLLGLAFAPDYATSGRVFVNFINLQTDTVIARFRRSASDPLRADPATRFDLRWPDGQRVITQPFANHNGGHLAFGPDGYLYIGMGDGGSATTRCTTRRIRSRCSARCCASTSRCPTAIPRATTCRRRTRSSGGPASSAEIWSFGLRNPWRWSFDDPSRGGTGAMLIGDVGQNAFEEIDYEPAGRGGRNYGWRNREGAHQNVTSLPPFSQPLVDPIFEYGRSDAASRSPAASSIAARCSASPARGRYFFADFISGRVWSVQLTIAPGTGEATASDLVEHTGDLRAAAVEPVELRRRRVRRAVRRELRRHGVSALQRHAPPRPCRRRPRTGQAGAGRRGRRRPASPYRAARPPRVPGHDDSRRHASGPPPPADQAGTVVYRAPWGSLSMSQPDVDGDGRADLMWRLTTGPTASCGSGSDGIETWQGY